MKRHLLFSTICLMLLALYANAAYADYIGPNPDLRTYTEYTIEQVSIPGVYVQCVDETASPARVLGQYCDISDSQTPDGMTPPPVTSCSSFSGANKSQRTQTACECNGRLGGRDGDPGNDGEAAMSYARWHERKEELPEDGDVCVWHRKGNKPDRIRFGYYFHGEFRDKEVELCAKGDYVKASEVDYWMPVPILPEKVRK